MGGDSVKKGLNRWVMFENDVCTDCTHPKLAKISPPPKDGDTLQVIISCDCDMTVFDHAWKHARDSDELIVVGGNMKVEDMLKILGEELRRRN